MLAVSTEEGSWTYGHGLIAEKPSVMGCRKTAVVEIKIDRVQGEVIPMKKKQDKWSYQHRMQGVCENLF